MSNAYQLGRTRRVFAVAESPFRTSIDPVAADFIRTINYQIKADPTNKRPSKEKKRAPGIYDSFIGRVEASLEALGFYARPSGVTTALPEHNLIYRSAWGTVVNPGVVTTAEYAMGAVGGARLAHATGLAVDVVVSIECTDGFFRHRRLTLVSGQDVEWYPDLPAPPADGAIVASVPTYKFTTGRGPSLGLYDYNIDVDGAAKQKRKLDGTVIDKFALGMDANEELMVSCSGLAAFRTTEAAGSGTLPVEPASVTTDGEDVPTGMVGELYFNHDLMDALKTNFEFTNGLIADNRQAGTRMAREAYRNGRRDVMFKINANNQGIDDFFEAGGTGDHFALAQQWGLLQGYGCSLFMPRCENKEPNEDDPETETSFDYEVKCKERTYDGNNEAVMGIG